IRELAEIVGPVQEFAHRQVHSTLGLKLFLNAQPLLNRIQASAFAGQACNVEFWSVTLIDELAIRRGNLDTSLLINPDCVVPSEHLSEPQAAFCFGSQLISARNTGAATSIYLRLPASTLFHLAYTIIEHGTCQ